MSRTFSSNSSFKDTILEGRPMRSRKPPLCIGGGGRSLEDRSIRSRRLPLCIGGGGRSSELRETVRVPPSNVLRSASKSCLLFAIQFNLKINELKDINAIQ